jgi:hypothetical protein
MRADIHDGQEQRSNQRPDTLMQDRSPLSRQRLLQRTAGPYIRVKLGALAMSAECPVLSQQRPYRCGGLNAVSTIGDKHKGLQPGTSFMRIAASVLAVLLALMVTPAQTFAGGYANLVVVSGPGIQAEGIAIRGCWPGYLPFADIRKGAVAEPPVELSRYVLSGKTERGEIFTILYVRDPSSGYAFVYLPSLNETDYPQHLNDETGTLYPKYAGRWYPFLREAQFATWDHLIGEAVTLPGRS